MLGVGRIRLHSASKRPRCSVLKRELAIIRRRRCSLWRRSLHQSCSLWCPLRWRRRRRLGCKLPLPSQLSTSENSPPPSPLPPPPVEWPPSPSFATAAIGEGGAHEREGDREGEDRVRAGRIRLTWSGRPVRPNGRHPRAVSTVADKTLTGGPHMS